MLSTNYMYLFFGYVAFVEILFIINLYKLNKG